MSNPQRRDGAPAPDPRRPPQRGESGAARGLPRGAAPGAPGRDTARRGPARPAGPNGGRETWLTEYLAEALLDGTPVPPGAGQPGPERAAGDLPDDPDGTAGRAALRLAGVLAAARRGPDVLDPMREEAALAAFRAARDAPGTVTAIHPDEPRVLLRRAGGQPGAGRRTGAAVRARQAAMVALASVVALGGAAVALAGTGRLPVPGGGSGTGPVSSRPPAAVSPDGSSAGPSQPPSATPRPPAGPSAGSVPGAAEPPRTVAWCRGYLLDVQRRVTAPSAATTAYCLRLVKPGTNGQNGGQGGPDGSSTGAPGQGGGNQNGQGQNGQDQNGQGGGNQGGNQDSGSDGGSDGGSDHQNKGDDPGDANKSDKSGKKDSGSGQGSDNTGQGATHAAMAPGDSGSQGDGQGNGKNGQGNQGSQGSRGSQGAQTAKAGKAARTGSSQNGAEQGKQAGSGRGRHGGRRHGGQ